ncbi:MAG: glycine zipper 2TM domain-containing protein [Pseudomonadota bacterium]
MNKFSRAASFATSAVAVALLAACASPMQEQSSYPVSTYPSNTYPSNTYPAQGGAYGSQQQYVEYGRVTGVEVVRTQQQREVSPGGAIIGGIVGGVIGNQIGSGSGRDLATAAGVVGGAVAGNAIGRQNSTQSVDSYRITVRVDNGAMRTYDVGAPGDLRPGDRVRIENGVLYRS